MANSKRNTMTSRVWTRHRARDLVRCRHCEVDINVADNYVGRKMQGGRGLNKTVLYCVPCAEILNIV